MALTACRRVVVILSRWSLDHCCHCSWYSCGNSASVAACSVLAIGRHERGIRDRESGCLCKR
ncbi:hypothetical protein Dimus_010378, partial [Dionaea muscipula]